MNIPCDKTFLWVPTDLTLMFDLLDEYFNLFIVLLKTLSLAISFEWYVLGLKYFTGVFLDQQI
jgi:hypothetical protein